MKKIISVLVLAVLAAGTSLTAQNRVEGAPASGEKKLGMPGFAAMKDLNLTDDQKAKLKDLRKDFGKKDSLTKEQFSKQRDALRAEHRQAMAKILTPEQLAKLDKLPPERGQGQPFAAGNGQQGFRRQAVPMAQGPMMGNRQGQMRGQGMGRMLGRMQGGFQGRMQGRFQGRMQGRFQGRMQGRMMAQRGMWNARVRKHQAPMVNPEIRIKNQVDRLTKQLDLTPEQASKIQAIQEKHFKKDIAKYKKFEKKRDAQFKKRHGNLDEIKSVLTPEQVQKLDALKDNGQRMNGQGFQGGRNQGPVRTPNGQHGPMHGFGQGEN